MEQKTYDIIKGNLNTRTRIQYYNRQKNLDLNGIAEKFNRSAGNPVYFSIQAEKNCKVSIWAENKQSIQEKRIAAQKELLQGKLKQKPGMIRKEPGDQGNEQDGGGSKSQHRHHFGNRKISKQEAIHIEEELQDYYEANKHLIINDRAFLRNIKLENIKNFNRGIHSKVGKLQIL